VSCPAGTYAPEGGLRVTGLGGYTCLPCAAGLNATPAGSTSCDANAPPSPPPDLVFGAVPPPSPPVSSDLCYRVSTRPVGSAFRVAHTVIRPILALPAVHPHVRHSICGTQFAAGDPIPHTTMVPSRWRRGRYQRCEPRTGVRAAPVSNRQRTPYSSARYHETISCVCTVNASPAQVP
jgi:hypothetical protein